MTGLLALPAALTLTAPAAAAGPILPANAAAGVSLEHLGPRMRRYLDVPAGVLVLETLEESPAEDAGLRAGDVIVEADGARVFTPGHFSLAVSLHRGEELHVVVFRDGELYRTELDLPERPSYSFDELMGRVAPDEVEVELDDAEELPHLADE